MPVFRLSVAVATAAPDTGVLLSVTTRGVVYLMPALRREA